jgi:hypothetical protein
VITTAQRANQETTKKTKDKNPNELLPFGDPVFREAFLLGLGMIEFHSLKMKDQKLHKTNAQKYPFIERTARPPSSKIKPCPDRLQIGRKMRRPK